MTSSDEFIQHLTAHQARLDVFISALVPEAAAAKDVLQNANLTLWKKADQFTPGTNFWAWASTVAMYEVKAYRSQQKRDKRLFSDELVQRLASVAEARADAGESRRLALRTCLEKLSEEDRNLIKRRYFAGLRLAELAGELSRSTEGARKSLHRIRQALLSCIRATLAKEREL